MIVFHRTAIVLGVCAFNFHAGFGEVSQLGETESPAATHTAAIESDNGVPAADSLTIPTQTPSIPEIPSADKKDPPADSVPALISPDSEYEASAADSSALPADSTLVTLYPGISIEQDRLARQMLHYFHSFDWSNADKAGKKMQRLEKKRHLPPLSYLLMTGIRVMRIQNGAHDGDRARKNLLNDIKKLSSKGLEFANPEKSSDSCLTTNLFITGGIKGFVSTLEMHRNPVNAALNGFSALKHLQKALDRDTAIHDAYLGFGLFHCVLGKAPLIVRSALSAVGKDASVEKGLGYLRRSVHHGCYTNDIAAVYLAEFLSPYWGHEAEEKRALVHSLQNRYPENPYFVFLELEEALCFHPDMLFSFSLKERIPRRIARFKAPDDDAPLYSMLVKWQYLLIDPLPVKGIAPDTTFDLRGFSYYPAFLRALREKLIYDKDPSLNKKDRARRLRYIKERGITAARLLEASPHMPFGRKKFYLWHIRDALRIGR